MRIQKIKELANILSESNLEEINYEDKDFKVKIKRNYSESDSLQEDELDYIKSPLVGTYFETNPNIKIGEKVKKGQVLCVINSMKVMNEITSPIDGIVKEIKFSNNEHVSFDDNLILIEKL